MDRIFWTCWIHWIVWIVWMRGWRSSFWSNPPSILLTFAVRALLLALLVLNSEKLVWEQHSSAFTHFFCPRKFQFGAMWEPKKLNYTNSGGTMDQLLVQMQTFISSGKDRSNLKVHPRKMHGGVAGPKRLHVTKSMPEGSRRDESKWLPFLVYCCVPYHPMVAAQRQCSPHISFPSCL